MKGSGAALEVKNPVAEVDVKQVGQARRLTQLAGKKIGLCSNRKPGANWTLDSVAQLLGERHEDIRFERFDFTFPFSLAAIERMSESNCDGFIGTNAD